MKRAFGLPVLILGITLMTGAAWAADPTLAKVGGIYLGEKAAAIIQNYFNAVAPYTKVQASPYQDTAPLAAYIVYDAKAQVIRVTLVGSSDDQAGAAIETATNLIMGRPNSISEVSAAKLVRESCGIELGTNDLEFQFYDAVHDKLHQQGGGLFGKGGLFGGGGGQ
jgi:hypothetical protein